jgi:hypothetical protein
VLHPLDSVVLVPGYVGSVKLAASTRYARSDIKILTNHRYMPTTALSLDFATEYSLTRQSSELIQSGGTVIKPPNSSV